MYVIVNRILSNIFFCISFSSIATYQNYVWSLRIHVYCYC